MKNRPIALTVSVMSYLFSSQARSESDEKTALQGTCVEDQQLERPTASKECVEELTSSNSNVFKYYRAVPSYRGDEITSYVLIPNGKKIKLLKPLRDEGEIKSIQTIR